MHKERLRTVKKNIVILVMTVFLVNLCSGLTLTETAFAQDGEAATNYGVIFDGIAPKGSNTLTQNGAVFKSDAYANANGVTLSPPSSDRLGATLNFAANCSMHGIVTYSFSFTTSNSAPQLMAGINDWLLASNHRMIVDANLNANTDYVMSFVYNTSTAELGLYLNGVKESTPIFKPGPYKGITNVTLGAYAGGSLTITNAKITYTEFSRGDYGVYLENLPATGLEKTQNGARLIVSPAQNNAANASNVEGAVVMSVSNGSYVDSALIFGSDNTFKGIVNYEFAVKPQETVPNFYLKYIAGGKDSEGIAVNLTANRENLISFLYDANRGTWTVMLDENRLAEGSAGGNTGIEAIYLRCEGNSESVAEALLTNVKLEHKEKKDPVTYNFSSIQENEVVAKVKLGKDIVFMTNNNYYFAGGKKNTYPGMRAYEDEAEGVMVPASLLETTLNITLTYTNGTVYVNGSETALAAQVISGTVFIPVEKLAKDVLSKYVYKDDRGFVLISNSNRGYSNSSNSMATLEPIDYLYRYLQFERPSSDEIYDDVIANSYKTHPRMFIKKEEIPSLKEKVNSSPKLLAAKNSLIEKCNALIDAAPEYYHYDGSNSIFNACYKVKTRLMDLGICYLLTDDERYRERMWKEMSAALSWKDWNVDVHFLDSGEIGPGMAFAYDILYDYLTVSQRQYVRDVFEELYLDFAVGVYTGTSSFRADDGRLTRTNWGAVCANSMLMCALTFIDDESEDSEFTQKCKFIAQCALQAHEFPFDVPFPDGDVSEGICYWQYFVESLSWSVETLLNMCGTDYGLLSAPAFKKMPDFELHIQTNNGVYAHCDTEYNDSTLPVVPECFLIADFYDNDQQMEMLEHFREYMKVELTSRSLLWYQLPEFEFDADSYPSVKLFSQSIVAMRSGWQDEMASYLGASCGTIHSESHFDKGSFIYENQGQRWFVDLGRDDYNVSGGYFGEAGYTLYRKRAEGHNCLVINSTAADPGQTPNAVAKVVRLESDPGAALAVIDLSDVYSGKVSSYNRGFYMGEDRSTLIVQDELELKKDNSDIYYFLHTEGSIRIDSGGKSATVTQNGKSLKVEFICDADEWSVQKWDADPIHPENKRFNEKSRTKFKKIALVGKASGKLNISVKMTPLDGNTYEEHTLIPMAEWALSGEDQNPGAQLDSLTVNGEPLEGFQPEKSNYYLGLNTFEIPVIDGESLRGTVRVTQASSINDRAEITVTDDNGVVKQYYVYFYINYPKAYGTVVSGLPVSSTGKQENGISFTSKTDTDGDGTVTNDGEKLVMQTESAWKAIDAIFSYGVNNEFDSTVRYEFKVKTLSDVPNVYIKYYADGKDSLAGNREVPLAANSESNLSFVYNPLNGEWLVSIDGQICYNGVTDKDKGIESVYLRCASSTGKGEILYLTDINLIYDFVETADVQLESAGDGLHKAIFNVNCKPYFSDFSGEGICVIALYNGQNLVKVCYDDVSLNSEQKEYIAEIDASDVVYDRVEAYLWKKNLEPVVSTKK